MMMRRRRLGRAALPVVTSQFPLSISADKRYLVDAQGNPFFIQGDVPYSMAVQCTRTEATTYMDDMQAKGFNAAWISFIEHKASDNSPAWRNVEGNIPFTSGTDFGSMNSAYWDYIDFVVAGCKSRGILVLLTPAYWGITSASEEGWDTEVLAESDADLQSYGAFLANRYKGYGNILYIRGGDQNMSLSDRTKQNNIFTGIAANDPAAIITAHATTNNSSRDVWPDNELALDLIYKWPANGQYPYEGVKGSYDLSPVMPALFFEGQFEGSATVPMIRYQAWQSVLSGSCGHVYGHSIIWHFSTDAWDPTPWAPHLNDAGRVQVGYVKSLMTAYSWWKLVPKDDSSLVSSSLSSGASRVCAAVASDGSFAMVWKNDTSSVTVVMTNLAGSSVRARWYDPTNGTFSTVSGSPFANTGSRTFTHPGSNNAGDADRVLVLDGG